MGQITRRLVDKKVLGLCLLGTVVLFPTPARADAAAHAKAVDLFSKARKRIAAGDCEGAIPRLVESIQAEPSIGAELSLADCYEPSDPLQAWRQVEEAARIATDNHDVRLDSVNQHAAALAAKLPTVQINLPAEQNLPGLEVRVDGVKVDSFIFLRGPVATTPGKHLVDASAGAKAWSQSVETAAGQPVSVTVNLAEAAPATPVAPATPPTPTPAPPPPPPPEEAHGSPLRTVGFVVGGVGVAGLALGGVAGLVALSKKNSIESACKGNGAGTFSSCQAAPGSEDGARGAAATWANVSTASFIAGGALLVGGAVMIFAAPSSSGPAPKDRAAFLTFSPFAGPGQAGAAVSGAW
jgi:hypothetical protein